jgi:hypothetical protein
LITHWDDGFYRVRFMFELRIVLNDDILAVWRTRE